MKRKTINVSPSNLETHFKDGEMILAFSDANKTVRLHMDRWWIADIAQDLHRVIKEEQTALDALKESLQKG